MALMALPASAATIITVDNDAPGASYIGYWTTSTHDDGYIGLDYRVRAAGTAGDTFTWTPDITEPGEYEVYAWWTASSNRSSNATFTVYHDDDASPVVKDQKTQGCSWVLLGVFDFDGVNDYVELAQSPTGYVIADAVRWVKVESVPIPGAAWLLGCGFVSLLGLRKKLRD